MCNPIAKWPIVIFHLVLDFCEEQTKAYMFYNSLMRYSSAVRCGKAIKQLLANKDDNFWVLLFNAKKRYDNPIVCNIKNAEEKKYPVVIWRDSSKNIDREDLTDYEVPLKNEEYSHYEDKLYNRNYKSISSDFKHKHRGKRSTVTSERYNLIADRLSSFEKEYSPYDVREDMFYHGRECWCCGYCDYSDED